MDRYLQKGSRIKNPDRFGEYEIRDIIGTGASCVVYLADFFESSEVRTEHLLKEYNPKEIRIERDDHGILRVSDEKDHAAFEAGLRRFEAGYRMQLNVRRCSDMKNSTSNIQSIFEANGTRYIDMTVMEGKTYDQVQEDSLYDLLRRVKTITEVIADYHKNGLLHLDIKPENILALPETVEMVQMFDYDSVTPKKDVINSAFLSYTQSWAAQEQILPNRRNRICEATDLFAIGEILFYKLMGRHSESHERRSFSSYHFDCSADVFEGVNPRVFLLLEDILRHTICNKCADRYQAASELLEKLADAITFADPRKPFLQHHLPSKSAYFVGRDAQLQEIADRLKRTDKLFISGMGGMGKSELVKQYAHTYQDAYDAVIFAVCNTDLESMILDDSMLPIGNVQQWPDEKAQEYYTRKLKELQKFCNKRILIIVDNFNDLQDEALNAVLRLNCKMLFTTRCDVTEYNYEQMELGTMAEEYVWDLFCNWYARQPVDEERMYARQIIDLYQGHTMAIELIAKQMKASHISPKQMLDKLGTGGFRTSGRERVIHAKDGMHPKLNIHDHIRRLFNVLELNDEQVYILANLSLMPPSGVSAEQFHDWCQLDGYEDINELAEYGWLRQDTEADMISLHPVIADVMLDKLSAEFEQCDTMLKSILVTLASKDNVYDICSLRDFSLYLCSQICKINYVSLFGVSFLRQIAHNYHTKCNAVLLIPLMQKALDLIKNISNHTEQQVSDLHYTLSLVLEESREYDLAIQHMKTALDVHLSQSNPETCRTVMLKLKLGQMYCSTDAENAEELLTECLTLAEHLPELSKAVLAQVYRALGDLSLNKGKYIDAELHYHHFLDLSQNVELADLANQSLVSGYYSLSNTCLLQNKAQEALKYALDAKRICDSIPNNFNKIHINKHLFRIYMLLNDFERAIICMENTIALLQILVGEIHYDIADCFCHLAGALLRSNRVKEAHLYLEKALTISFKIAHPGQAINVEKTAGIAKDIIATGLPLELFRMTPMHTKEN